MSPSATAKAGRLPSPDARERAHVVGMLGKGRARVILNLTELIALLKAGAGTEIPGDSIKQMLFKGLTPAVNLKNPSHDRYPKGGSFKVPGIPKTIGF